MPVAPEQFGVGVQSTTTTADPGIAGATLSLTAAAIGKAFTGSLLRISVQNSPTDATNEELMLVTAGYGTTTLTVTRGVEGTAAVAHPVGSFVQVVLTPESVRRYASPQNYLPRHNKLLAWNYDPACLSANVTTPLVAGRTSYYKLPIAEALTITNVLAYISTAGATLTGCFAGVFNKAGTQVGTSADQSTVWTSTGLKTMALTGGPFTVDPAGDPDYWLLVALLAATQTTAPQFQRTIALTNLLNAGLVGGTDFPRVGQDTRTGQTTLAASVTAAQDGVDNTAIWVACS